MPSLLHLYCLYILIILKNYYIIAIILYQIKSNYKYKITFIINLNPIIYILYSFILYTIILHILY